MARPVAKEGGDIAPKNRQRVVDWMRPFFFRGKNRILNMVVPPSGVRRATVFGSEMGLDLGEHIQRGIYLGVYEPVETRIVRRWLRPGMTFVDVGANVGYYAALAAQLVQRNGTVIAVEPSPVAFASLKRLVAENRLHQVRTCPFALGSVDGKASLFLGADVVGLHSPSMVSHERGGEEVSVEVRRLDSCLDAWGIATVDLIKLDIEGFELEVLEGAGRALADGRIRAILCEFNATWLRRAGTSAEALHGFLVSRGFRSSFVPASLQHDGLENVLYTYARR